MSLLPALYRPLHRALVQGPRAERLASVLAELAAPADTVLDVGAGDGELGSMIAARLGARARGVDVKVPAQTHIDVEPFDGMTIPMADRSIDAVVLSDVLHHAIEPEQLLREALRVARACVVVKDHFRYGPLSDKMLVLLDKIGNRPYGVDVVGRYWSPVEWMRLLEQSGAVIRRIVWPLHVHAAPIRAITRSELQFAARLERRGHS
ncbi:MAG: methyltransferase domain-containing protein [Polyangiaceae bacterium]|nr:methyltransferase domain-containing protein [Polyangiaceae bacterium]